MFHQQSLFSCGLNKRLGESWHALLPGGATGLDQHWHAAVLLSQLMNDLQHKSCVSFSTNIGNPYTNETTNVIQM